VVYETVMPTAVVEQTVIEQTIVQPVVILPTLCEPFVGACRRHGRRARPPQPPVKTSGICNVGVDCPEGVGAPARALLVPRRASLVMSPRRRPVPPPVAPPAVPPAASRVVRLAAPVTAPAPAAAPHAPRATTSRTIALYSAPLRRAAMAAPASRPSPAAVAAPARRSGTMVLPRPVTKQRVIATARGSARPR
jgi:hypothetical protein